MIRLLLTVIACLALHPAGSEGAAWEHATIGVAGGGERVALPGGGAAALPIAVLPTVLQVVAPSGAMVDAPSRAWWSWRAVARLWLRGARILC